jgi:hypothetical protein
MQPKNLPKHKCLYGISDTQWCGASTHPLACRTDRAVSLNHYYSNGPVQVVARTALRMLQHLVVQHIMCRPVQRHVTP